MTRTDGLVYWANGGILDDGMTYANGHLTVPKDGLYFIYSSIACKSGTNTFCGHRIKVNGGTVALGFHSPESSRPFATIVVNRMCKLRKGDRISLVVTGRDSQYGLAGYPDASFLGAVHLA